VNRRVPLVVTDLTVTYPDGHQALDGVDVRVGPGERCGVVGRSGSGKTTLVRAVLGLLPPGTRTRGSIRVGDRELLGAPESELRRLRGLLLGYVPQDPFAACDPLRTVGHHIREAWTAHRQRPPAGATTAALSALGLADPAHRLTQRPHQWSGGMLQRATLVAATVHTPLLTLADEPTSALDAELADEVLTVIARRTDALLVISHDLALLARHTDTLLVLEDGRPVEHGPSTALLRTPAAAATRALIADADVTPRPPRPPNTAPAAGPRPAPSRRTPVAVVRSVSRVYRHAGVEVTAVDRASLEIAGGQVIGIIGRSGSGKSTLARLLAGMERPDHGQVELGGHDVWTRGRRLLRPGYVMPVFQDPVASLDRRWPLWRTLAEPLRARGHRRSRSRHRQLAAQHLALVGLADLDPDRLPGTLSVGQAQRVAIARALAAEPALLVADEPTASLDTTSTATITALLRRIADTGTAVLVVSHDAARLASYADRVLTMTEGRLTGDAPKSRQVAPKRLVARLDERA
jgi:peptide/nickel transport system ATP-binding protein